MLNSSILRQIAPQISPERAVKLAKLLNEICPMYGINTPDIMHEFIANVLHESNAFNNYSESLNYSVEALTAKFGSHRITAEQAEQFGRKPGRPANQEAIANTLYGGTWGHRSLGNIQPGDGWRFRGAGPIQITGRANFTRFAMWMDKVHAERLTLTQLSNALRVDDRIAIHSACWVFAVAKNLIQAAIDDNFNHIVKRINGGFIGMDDRVKYYERAKRFIV